MKNLIRKKPNNIRVTHWYRRMKLEALMHYGGNPPKCECCGESHVEFLTIDHIHGGGRKHTRERAPKHIYCWLKENDYPDGFRVLCYNCNCAIGFFGVCPHEKELTEIVLKKAKLQ